MSEKDVKAMDDVLGKYWVTIPTIATYFFSK